MRKCPYCAEEIQEEAIKCKHCGEMLDKHSIKKPSTNDRKCHQCGYIGQMKTWLRNYNFPQFIIILGLLFYVLPGLIFWAWGWRKYKCPSCGALAKNSLAING
ncbi:double zinc ribbon [bacterium BMS3Abin15]|nr:double zinc ribbon [bacterium BMS3Abin15]